MKDVQNVQSIQKITPEIAQKLREKISFYYKSGKKNVGHFIQASTVLQGAASKKYLIHSPILQVKRLKVARMLGFPKSNCFTNKSSQGRKLSAKKYILVNSALELYFVVPGQVLYFLNFLTVPIKHRSTWGLCNRIWLWLDFKLFCWRENQSVGTCVS